MRNTILLLATCVSLSACGTMESGENNTAETTKQETRMEDNKSKAGELTFTYSEGNVSETIKISLSEDGKKIVSGTHQIVGGTAQPITFTDVEYNDDLGMFLGSATSAAWESEMMVGMSEDLTQLSFTDGKTRKVFNQ